MSDTIKQFAPVLAFERKSKFIREPLAEIEPRGEEWRVKGLIPAQGVGFLAGPSGAGKSFLALAWSLAVACGQDVLGHRTKRAGVVYVAAEAPNGVRKRIKAWRQKEGRHAAPFELIGQAPDLRNEDDVGDLIATLREAAAAFEADGQSLGLVVIDTLAASMPGGNENDGADMSALVANLQRIAAETGAFALTVTHTGKDEARGIRGWSGQFAGADTVFMLTKDETDPKVRVGTVAKMKDGEDGERFAFRLDRVVLGHDEDGDEITSAVPVFEDPPEPKAKGRRAAALPPQARIVLDALNYLMDHGPTVTAPPVPGREGGGPAVTRDALRERAMASGLFEGASAATGRQRFYGGLEKLKAEGLIRVEGDNVWPILKPAT
jgi:hypothetical protein